MARGRERRERGERAANALLAPAAIARHFDRPEADLEREEALGESSIGEELAYAPPKPEDAGDWCSHGVVCQIGGIIMVHADLDCENADRALVVSGASGGEALPMEGSRRGRGRLGWNRRRTHAMRSLIGLTAVAVVGACAPDPAIGAASYVQPVAGDSCQNNSCGNGNSPVIDGVYFWRLHIASLPGQPNPQDVWITSVQSSIGSPMHLELVGGDRLRGIDAAGGVVEHTALEGTRIGVSVLVDGQPKEYVIEIQEVAPSVPIGYAEPEEWFWVGFQRPIEAYEFFYRPLEPGDRIPLCSEGDGDPNKIRALVFGGDLYDPATKQIEVGPTTDGWINVACVDSAIYKMHKIGYTSAAEAKAGVPPTSVERRRAMLNAWTSNVCGTGEAFTEQGEPIKLRESLGVLPDDSQYLDPLDGEQTASLEAIWSQDGAVCLDVHRREDVEPGITQELKTTACGKPIQGCTGKRNNWTSHGHVITGNPKP